MFVIQKRYKNTTLLYSYVLLSMKGTQQQLISLHTEINFDEHKSNCTFIRFLHRKVF